MANLSWKIGEARVTRVVESESTFDATNLLPQATPATLEPHADWLRPHFMDDAHQITLAIQALVVESCGQRILVDTCIGDRVVPGFDELPAGGNPFLPNLEAAGFSRDAIHVVLCTHLHFDHVGWNTVKEGERWVPTFPNARYLFARKEWEHWNAEREKAQEYAFTFDEAVVPVIDAGLADLVEWDHRINGEVWLEPTPGHTPGHVAVRIASGGEEALITGDLAHHPVQWAEPDWGMSADSDSKEAARTRRRVLRDYGDTPLLVIGTHFAAPTAGHLVSRDGSWTFRTDGPGRR